MRFVIVTGMSGAGKSTALRVLEDAGFFCVDNLPIALISKFADLIFTRNQEITKAALGIDIRSGQALEAGLKQVLEEMTAKNYNYEILFLDAMDEVLIKRYKETRRSHPLSVDGRINRGLVAEREKVAFLKKLADYILDTSQLLTRELKLEIEKIFIQDESFKNLFITVLSFGFKYGIPIDADIVMDVRFLPNPYYVKELREKTGNDQAVYDYVMNSEMTEEFYQQFIKMLRFVMPGYQKEGKSSVTIAIGCTGGQHRSVALANRIGKALQEKYPVNITHRDMAKRKETVNRS